MLNTQNETATIFKNTLHPADIRISGYKHSVTVIIAASLAKPGKTIELTNVPKILDVEYLTNIICQLGGDITASQNKLTINTDHLAGYKIPTMYSQYIHGAIYLLPVILGRLKKIELGLCGGCQIGEPGILGNRPIEHMLSVLKKFGAEFKQTADEIQGKTHGYIGCEIDIMDYSEDNLIITGPLVSGATKTAILAGCLATGKTKILNPYLKPDVTELLKFLKKLGHTIIYGKNFIEIKPALSTAIHVNYAIMSDISQIISFICLAIYHDIALSLTNITVAKVKKGLASEILCLEQMGINLKFTSNKILISTVSSIKAIDINVTSIGIFSDHQPFFALMLSKANQISRIKENVWKNRFSYALELRKLGFNLEIDSNSLKIIPNTARKYGEALVASDLRAAAVLLIASLNVSGKTIIEGIQHLKRGHEDFIEDLRSLGAKIETKLHTPSIEGEKVLRCHLEPS